MEETDETKNQDICLSRCLDSKEKKSSEYSVFKYP